MLSSPYAPLVLNSELVMRRQENKYKSAISISCLSQELFCDLERALHPVEFRYYNNLKFEKRKKEYLLGRYSAKKALSRISRESELERILIEQGIFNQPVVSGSDMVQNLEVTITHCDDLAAAIAFPQAYPLGIDLERVSPDRIRVMNNEMTGEEKKILQALPTNLEISLTSLWTAKEALSKVLKTGLNTPFHIFEITKTEENEGYLISHYKYFNQYWCFSFNWGGYIFSITCPKGTVIAGDTINLIKKIYFEPPDTWK